MLRGQADPPAGTVRAGSARLPSSSPFDQGRFLPGTILAGRYRIFGLLGKGGMGEVYRADDLKLGQAVALKFLPEDVEKDPIRLSRFLNEVKIARQISHPSVCRVYDVGEVDGHHFLSMEYVDGEDLASGIFDGLRLQSKRPSCSPPRTTRRMQRVFSERANFSRAALR